MISSGSAISFPLPFAALLCATLGLATGASPLSAQEGATVVGMVVEEDGRTVPAVLVTLEDPDGRRLLTTLTDGAGRFRLAVPDPGLYLLRAERLGYGPTQTDRFEVNEGETFRIGIRLSPDPIRLEGVELEASEPRCVLSPEEGSVLAELWHQARQVFARVEATRDDGALRFDLRRYERAVEIMTAEIILEHWTQDRESALAFRSPPAEELVEQGWVKEIDSYDVEYYGPDPDVLLSAAFERSHCFRLRTDADRPGDVGVSFEPIEHDLPAIQGTLWMDRSTGALRELRFHYTRHFHRPEIPERLLELFGGEMEFRTLPDGRWVVDRWVLRMPAFRNPDEIGPTSGRQHPELVQRLDRIQETVESVPSWRWRNEIQQGFLVFYEEGGELARIESADGTIVAEREREEQMELPTRDFAFLITDPVQPLRPREEPDTTIRRDGAAVVQGQVRDAATGDPVGTARVTLLSEDEQAVHTTLTDDEGRFVLRTTVAGLHLLEADRLGYRVARTDPFSVESEGLTTKDVPLAPQAVEVEEMVVEGYAGQLLHDATLGGVLARRARSPSVGNNRVLVRGDPDLDARFRVRDVLPGVIPTPLCPHRNEQDEPVPFLFFNGWEAGVMGPEGTDFVLDLPIREIEAVEYYRDLTSAPMSLRPMEPQGIMRRDDNVYRDPVRACGIVAVWSRGAPR